MISKKFKKKGVTNNYGNTTVKVEKSNAKPPADPKKRIDRKDRSFFLTSSRFICRLGPPGDFLLGFGLGAIGEGKGENSLQCP